MQKRGVMVLAFVQIAVAMVLIGGMEGFISEKKQFFVIVGLCLLGVSLSMVTIPVFPEMIESIE